MHRTPAIQISRVQIRLYELNHAKSRVTRQDRLNKSTSGTWSGPITGRAYPLPYRPGPWRTDLRLRALEGKLGGKTGDSRNALETTSLAVSSGRAEPLWDSGSWRAFATWLRCDTDRFVTFRSCFRPKAGGKLIVREMPISPATVLDIGVLLCRRRCTVVCYGRSLNKYLRIPSPMNRVSMYRVESARAIVILQTRETQETRVT
jgi:hypothetical protein